MRLIAKSLKVGLPVVALVALVATTAVALPRDTTSDAGASARESAPSAPAVAAVVPPLVTPDRIGPALDVDPVRLALYLQTIPQVRFTPPAPPGPPPAAAFVASLPAGERWVLVDLSDQTTVLYAGDTPVHTALVTTGKAGWETPVGTFTIGYRVENETMTSAALGIPADVESYELTDVLYTQYFTNEGHALHLNYWRPESVFGAEATSHGCVGMRLGDAEILWRALGVGSRVVIQA